MLAILGGTGPEGKGLALRLAMAGETPIIGSRDAGRGADAAEELAQSVPGVVIKGSDNAGAVASADVVFLAFPYEGQRPVLEDLGAALKGKIVVSVIAPMKFERGKGASAVEVEAGSAAQEAQDMLPDSQVVAAFQNASAEELLDPSATMEGDVVVCSDHPEAKKLVMELAGKIKDLRGVDGGSLANAKYVEQLTPLLVNINRIYKIHAGIKIVGV
ncbi:MAG: NADPH-dependent F420 reductase [SAR202 cluster bacterium]|jgi:NADPH-dependent F420 reductase|nr:NADPH-dependent F420 reductase [Chloroflexota bacterium]MEC7749571.1 NADPH-dependent F420 reductase [Chloroflexota bacterium]MQG49077.1 NADPH-dependent F420 reductase [SAR202 cluster bacterium]MQG78487.1 NADPH-dependent F420 reductase [SAR202 cluster bacterium]|tara:strand:- start:494 stop:1141 length:648 start_codon:yes stop_codon:yes gene_type:complete